jgi:hypothetical protein
MQGGQRHQVEVPSMGLGMSISPSSCHIITITTSPPHPHTTTLGQHLRQALCQLVNLHHHSHLSHINSQAIP